jgi:imidazoleglycerol-phosphate dehydratase
MRGAQFERTTKETAAQVRLSLDGRGRCTVETGVGFLDHMLTHIATHGLFDLELKLQGDLEVDVHHSVEDAALVLGEAFDRALGERRGISRIGSAFAPMDDSLAFVAVDLSGRAYSVVQVGWHTQQVGGLPTSLIPHFFDSFANRARANVHVRLLYSLDDHHAAEALFKAFGRALDAASRIDPRRAGEIPSPKGVI